MSKEVEEDYIKKLGHKEYPDKLWSKVDDEVESIHKRLGDTWNHPTCEEVNWFHNSWRRLYKVLGEYQAAETKYLPQEEQPKAKTDDPAIIKNGRPAWEFMATREADGTSTLNGFNECEIGEGKDYIDTGLVEGKIAYINEYDEGVIPGFPKWHPTEPTTILSKAIEQAEQMGYYKVMVALVDLDKGDKPKEERLYTFTDIESKKLREVIYKEIEKEVSNE